MTDKIREKKNIRVHNLIQVKFISYISNYTKIRENKTVLFMGNWIYKTFTYIYIYRLYLSVIKT